jgi:anti-sigma factor RsiW
MSSPHNHDFDEALISGLLDGALTQQEAQKVSLHVEACPACRRILEQLTAQREDTMTSRFTTPSDDQWNERPRGFLSAASFGVGWTILIIWLVGVAGFAFGQLWTGDASVLEKLLVFSAIAGIVLVFLSVLIDRLSRLGSDRYRRIEK